MTVHAVLIAIPDDTDLDLPRRRRRQREYARLALRRCAELSDAPLEGWRQDAQDVPLPSAGFHWSISHKRRWACAVVADHAIGIDIECITPRREGLFSMVGGDGEWDRLGGRSWENFYRLFTAKEATLKAHGLGIGYLRDCVLTEVQDERHLTMQHAGRRCPIEHFRHDGHIAAVSGAGRSIQWNLLERNSDTTA